MQIKVKVLLQEGTRTRNWIFIKNSKDNFSKDELINIAKELSEQNGFKGNDKMLIDIISFHMDWKNETNSVDNVQCFTIREIKI